jgi:hypothetical protein
MLVWKDNSVREVGFHCRLLSAHTLTNPPFDKTEQDKTRHLHGSCVPGLSPGPEHVSSDMQAASSRSRPGNIDHPHSDV